jgi:hypothetical protein
LKKKYKIAQDQLNILKKKCDSKAIIVEKLSMNRALQRNRMVCSCLRIDWTDLEKGGIGFEE